MPTLAEEPPALITPSKLDHAELSLLRIENADFRMRESIAAEAYHRLRGETERLRKDLAAERLNNSADRRRMDLLVTLCRLARSSREGVTVNDGEALLVNPADLRAALDIMLASGATKPAPGLFIQAIGRMAPVTTP